MLAYPSLIAATIGLTLVNFIKPGDGLDEATRSDLMERFAGGAESMTASGPPEFGINTFVNIIPRNPVAAAADMDMLALIFFSLIFGAALTMIPREKAQPVIDVVYDRDDRFTVFFGLSGVGMALALVLNNRMIARSGPGALFSTSSGSMVSTPERLNRGVLVWM